MKMHTNHRMNAQRGAALIVALILLLVITILGISMMGSSRMQLVMAGNTQFNMLAFQAAQSAIEQRLAAATFTTSMASNPQPYTYPGATVTADMVYRTATDVPAGGYSLGAGFLAYHFEITASATGRRGASSSQAQGVYIVGPGGS